MNPTASSGDVVELTRALVRTPSVNPVLEEGGAGEEDVARLCGQWLSDWGFDTRTVEVAPGRWNVEASFGSGAPVTLLNGHLDTVGADGMTVPPFGGDIRDGRLYGRGSADMKGGVAAMLSAAHAFSESTDRTGTLQVMLTADEEHASLGMQALVEGALTADRAVVCEPTELTVMPAHKGFLWLTAEVRGVAAHGSRPDLGVDAVRHAGQVIHALERLHENLAAGAQHPLLGPGSFHFGRIRGGAAPSVYPDHCSLEIERRTLPHEGPEVESAFADILERLRRESGIDVTLTRDLYRPGSDVAVDSPVVVDLLDAMEAVGLPRCVEGMTAWVDAAYLNEAGIPSVCFGPGSIGQAHTADESVPVQELRTAASVLTRFLGV